MIQYHICLLISALSSKIGGGRSNIFYKFEVVINENDISKWVKYYKTLQNICYSCNVAYKYLRFSS